jgi:hypothetical protein
MPTSHQLDVIGAELMLRAEEIDDLLGHYVATKKIS